jgi:hypothetical protein
MSFGTSNTTKNAQNIMGGTASNALNTEFPTLNTVASNLGTEGTNLLGLGGSNVNSGTGFFNTLLNGNAANTAATLAPSIAQIQGGTANNLSAINTLMPRGGGRYSALFGQSLAPQSQIQNLFNSGRTTAAQALPQIGLAQEGVGTGLLGLGNQAYGLANQDLNIANQSGSGLGNLGLSQEQINNALASGLGSGIVGMLSGSPGGGSGGTGLFNGIATSIPGSGGGGAGGASPSAGPAGGDG